VSSICCLILSFLFCGVHGQRVESAAVVLVRQLVLAVAATIE
jgi:hypothetical protein